MFRILDMMREDLVLLDLAASDPFDACSRVASWLGTTGWIPKDTQGQVGERLIQKEKINPTALGRGVAIPHCYFEKIPEPMIIFARFSTPVDFQAADGELVRMVFLLLGPKRNDTEHLMILARLSRLLKDGSFKARLLEAASGADVIEAVRDVENRH